MSTEDDWVLQSLARLKNAQWDRIDQEVRIGLNSPLLHEFGLILCADGITRADVVRKLEGKITRSALEKWVKPWGENVTEYQRVTILARNREDLRKHFPDQWERAERATDRLCVEFAIVLVARLFKSKLSSCYDRRKVEAPAPDRRRVRDMVPAKSGVSDELRLGDLDHFENHSELHASEFHDLMLARQLGRGMEKKPAGVEALRISLVRSEWLRPSKLAVACMERINNRSTRRQHQAPGAVL